MAHTPGPWNSETSYSPRAFNREHAIRIYAENPGPASDFHVGYVIDVDAQTRKANAYLIAAAPELLEALKEAKEFIENQQLPDTEWSRILDVSVAAIAKAEGRL